jgi:transcription elongation factor Elf1/thiol-disulfide isomerase/thioredoxin
MTGRNNCPVCGESFPRETSTRDHAWDVHGVCHHCGASFETRSALYTHWLEEHEDDLTTEDRKRAESKVGDRTVCPVCEQRFASDTAVHDHTWDAHGACYLCGESFDTQDALFTHQLAIHDDELSRATRDRAEAAVAPLTFGNRLAHQGPVGAITNTSVSRRKLIAGGGVAAIAGVGGVAADSLFGSSASAQSSGSGGTTPGTTAAPATFTTIDDEEKQLSDYRGQKVMFWIFATWCPSCIKGAQALQAKNDELQDMSIIALKTFGNAGSSGPSVSEFAQQYAPQLLEANNWVWGDLSKKSTRVWNPRNRPDIFWLIGTDGTIQTKTAAPAATIDQIVQFAQGTASDRPGESIKIQPSKHIQPGESHPDYNSNPPTSGWHYPEPAAWGFYDKALPDERVVHNLEHGGIWITYTNVSDDTLSKLQQLAREYPKSVIVTKRPANDAPIAVASWGQLLELESFDRAQIIEFIEQNRNQSPEPIAGQ